MRVSKPWRVTASKILVEHRFIRLTEDTLVHPDDGRSFKYYYLAGSSHAVAVVALTDERKIVLTRQYRHPVGAVIYDLPAGRVDRHETPLEAARRELAEETGYSANHIEHLTFYIQFPGVLQTGTNIFFATDLTPGQQNLDQFEDLEVIEFSITDTLTLITNHKIIDGSLMLGVLFAKAKGLI